VIYIECNNWNCSCRRLSTPSFNFTPERLKVRVRHQLSRAWSLLGQPLEHATNQVEKQRLFFTFDRGQTAFETQARPDEILTDEFTYESTLVAAPAPVYSNSSSVSELSGTSASHTTGREVQQTVRGVGTDHYHRKRARPKTRRPSCTVSLAG
jgi:hypothetical protein